jgi:L-asparagine transporter-like permease
MKNRQVKRPFLPIVSVFIVSTAILLAAPSLDFLWGMSRSVMVGGNIVLFLATAISFYLYYRSLQNNNAQVFLRMIYSGMFAKMMICLFAALLYIMIVKENVSKGAIFGCMFLYLVYTFMEVSIIMKLSRKDKHAKERSAA